MLGIPISPSILNSKAYLMEIKKEFLKEFDDAEFVRKFAKNIFRIWTNNRPENKLHFGVDANFSFRNL